MINYLIRLLKKWLYNQLSVLHLQFKTLSQLYKLVNADYIQVSSCHDNLDVGLQSKEDFCGIFGKC